jgi:molecular chaperone DnaK (HSP70)
MTKDAHFLGIHIGLDELIVARFSPSGHTESCHNSLGDSTTPAVIQILPNNDCVIGKEAERALGTGENVIADFVRHLGTDRTWPVNGRDITPSACCAILFKKLVNDYREEHGDPAAVTIAHPDNFRHAHRAAIFRAFKMAGIAMPYLITESAGAGLFFSSKYRKSGQQVVILTDKTRTEISIFETNKGVVRTTYSEGIQHLGSNDIESALKALIDQKFTSITGQTLASSNCMLTRWEIAEMVHGLSSREQITICLRSSVHGLVRIEITSREFEDAIGHLILQLRLLCESTLSAANCIPEEIKAAYLMGEIFNVSAVQKPIRGMFHDVLGSDNDAHAMAFGASLNSALQCRPDFRSVPQSDKIRGLSIQHTAPAFLGVVVVDETGERRNLIVVQRYGTLPSQSVLRFPRQDVSENGFRLIMTEAVIYEDDPDYVDVIKEYAFPQTTRRKNILELRLGYDRFGMLEFECEWISGEVPGPDDSTNPRRYLGPNNRHLNLTLPEA